jgi:phosphoribosyl 1,2-cyclic phosphodiesterase
LNLTVRAVEPFQRFTVGPYRVYSLRANHDPDHLVAMLYLVEQDGRCLFYATDTGELSEETWAYLAEFHSDGGRIDLVAMDHTFGLQGRVDGHMNWEQFTEQIARLRSLGLLSAGARVFAHHLAHHSNPVHEELEAFAAPHRYEVAYDGLVVEV